MSGSQLRRVPLQRFGGEAGRVVKRAEEGNCAEEPKRMDAKCIEVAKCIAEAQWAADAEQAEEAPHGWHEANRGEAEECEASVPVEREPACVNGTTSSQLSPLPATSIHPEAAILTSHLSCAQVGSAVVGKKSVHVSWEEEEMVAPALSGAEGAAVVSSDGEGVVESQLDASSALPAWQECPEASENADPVNGHSEALPLSEHEKKCGPVGPGHFAIPGQHIAA